MIFIKSRRIAAKMTQSELAVKIGVLQSAVANWESGASDPRARDLPLIAKELHCTIDELYEEVSE